MIVLCIHFLTCFLIQTIWAKEYKLLSFLLNIFSSLLHYLISEPITAACPALWMLCKVQYESVMVDDLCDSAVWSFLCLGLHFGICTTSSLVWRILLEVDRVPYIKMTWLCYGLDNQGFHTWQGLGIFLQEVLPA